MSEPAPILALTPVMDTASTQANEDSSGFSSLAPKVDSSMGLSPDSNVPSIAAASPPPVIEIPVKPNKDTVSKKPSYDTAIKNSKSAPPLKPVASTPAKSSKDSVPVKPPADVASKKPENIPAIPKPNKEEKEIKAKPKSALPAEIKTVEVPAKPVRADSPKSGNGPVVEATKKAIARTKPETESVAMKADNTAFLEASKIRLKSELELSKRLVMSFSALNLAYSSQIADAEYDAMAHKTTTLLNDTRKTKERLNSLNDRLPSELGNVWGILATGEAFLISAGVNAERFFKAEKEDEEKRRLEAFRQDIESASIALRDAGEALDIVKP